MYYDNKEGQGRIKELNRNEIHWEEVELVGQFLRNKKT